MADYTITLSELDVKSMDYVTADIDDWITNSAQNRARKAKERIISLLLEHCNANGIAMATGEAAQVQQAFDLKVVEKASNDIPE
tara:strand:+ start:1939 stop:2190 length:252 start_codon:yes stop_codon:yes gene_type:complete